MLPGRGFMGFGGNPLDSRKLIVLIALAALAARLTLAPMHIDYGRTVADVPRGYEYCRVSDTLPFDFYGYVCPAQRMLAGKSVYANYSIHRDGYRGFPYPPYHPLAMAAVISLFGPDFMWMKVPSALFDAGIVVLVFLIAERLFDTRRGNVAALAYAFSYNFLINSGAYGNDDHYFMFFVMAGVYFLIAGRLPLSSVSMAGALAFKVSALLFLPPMAFYIWRSRGLKAVFAYNALAIVVTGALIAPFFASEGQAVLNPYKPGEGMQIDGYGVLNVIRLTYGLPYHAVHRELLLRHNDPADPMTYGGTHPFQRLLRLLELPFNAIGFLIAAVYVLRYRMASAERELARNSFVFTLAMMAFSKAFYEQYFLWLTPFLIILFAEKARGIGRLEAAGMALVYAACLVQAGVWTTLLYRPFAEHAWLWAAALLAVAGSCMMYRVFGNGRWRTMSALALISVYSNFAMSLPFIVFHPLVAGYIGLDALRQLTFYVGNYVAGIFTLCMMYVTAGQLRGEEGGA